MLEKEHFITLSYDRYNILMYVFMRAHRTSILNVVLCKGEMRNKPGDKLKIEIYISSQNKSHYQTKTFIFVLICIDMFLISDTIRARTLPKSIREIFN